MDASEKVQKRDKEISMLQRELAQKNEQIQQYERELVNNSVIKRWKIGKYLHDNLAQQLISAKLTASSLRNELQKENLIATCDKIISTLDESIEEVRDLSHDIIPMDVEKEGVGQAFNYLIKQAEKQYGINCMLETGKILDKINRREIATNLYHIAQEAIKNAVMHGKAQRIKVALIEHNQQLYLHIKDDGAGYNPSNEKNGMGIMIMNHRAKEMGGNFKIKDAKDKGYTTCVTCSIPMEIINK